MEKLFISRNGFCFQWKREPFSPDAVLCFLMSALLELGDRPDALFQCVRSVNVLWNKRKRKSKIAGTSQMRVESDIKHYNKAKDVNLKKKRDV